MLLGLTCLSASRDASSFCSFREKENPARCDLTQEVNCGFNKPWEVIALEQLTHTLNRHTTTQTRVAYDKLHLACDKFSVHKLHQGDILKKGCFLVAYNYMPSIRSVA